MAVEAKQSRAFDAHRPPEAELIEDCVHCGFCLPTCPTYVLWGEEMDSPRGRIVLMSGGLEEGSEMSHAMATHFDRCLGCMACVTACPSGVQYDKLIEATRPQVERNYRRPPRERIFRRLLFAAFTHPERVRAIVPLLALYRGLGLDRMAATDRLERRWPRLAALERLAPRVPVRAAWRRLPEVTPALGTRRGRVGFLQGCVQRVFFGDVNRASVRVLAAEGFEAFAPASVRCCGALQFHSGFEDDALDRARDMIEAFDDCDYVVTNAAGCGSSMKDYGGAFADDSRWAERARRFSDKVRDISEFLASFEPVAKRHPLGVRVAYHDACHLAHAQGIRAEPRRLLQAIPDLELVEPADWEVCCGSAGIYNLLQPEAGAELGRRKAANLLAARPEAIVAGNPGCTLQIGAYLRAAGHEVPIYHPVQLIDASIEGGSL